MNDLQKTARKADELATQLEAELVSVFVEGFKMHRGEYGRQHSKSHLATNKYQYVATSVDKAMANVIARAKAIARNKSTKPATATKEVVRRDPVNPKKVVVTREPVDNSEPVVEREYLENLV